MSALLTDLELRLAEDGSSVYVFTWEAEESQDWQTALELVKAIPGRKPLKQEVNGKIVWRWQIPVTQEAQLARVFPNFARQLEAMKSQTSLFGDDRIERMRREALAAKEEAEREMAEMGGGDPWA